MATQPERDTIMAAVTGQRVNGSGWVRINCPVCPGRGEGKDRKHSFGYRPLTGGFRCFRCKVNGRMSGQGYVLPEDADAYEEEDDRPKVDIPYDDFFQLWTDEMVNSPALAEARAFLEARGIMREHWRDANIHAAVSGKYVGRIIVPHEDTDQKWWGFTARLYPQGWAAVENALLKQEEPPKVLYPANMDRSRLYNEQALYLRNSAPVMLVEGCLDAAWYMPDVVASLGKPTSAHFDKLCHVARPLVICLDGDAWEDGRALTQRLALRGVAAAYVQLPAKEDPNSVDPNWLRAQVRVATENQCNTSNHSP